MIKEKSSLLVRDAQMDQALREQMSIVEQKVRSMIAVPLQTNDRVIGLIYVDSPHPIREFTREDLNLLTVMANVAAIRIEHARLNEIEEGRARHGQGDGAGRADPAGRCCLRNRPTSPAWTSSEKPRACRTVGGDYYDYLDSPTAASACWWATWPAKACPRRC